jgi:hypothetical protein
VGRLEGPAEWDSSEALALLRHFIGDRLPRLQTNNLSTVVQSG